MHYELSVRIKDDFKYHSCPLPNLSLQQQRSRGKPLVSAANRLLVIATEWINVTVKLFDQKSRLVQVRDFVRNSDLLSPNFSYLTPSQEGSKFVKSSAFCFGFDRRMISKMVIKIIPDAGETAAILCDTVSIVTSKAVAPFTGTAKAIGGITAPTAYDVLPYLAKMDEADDAQGLAGRAMVVFDPQRVFGEQRLERPYSLAIAAKDYIASLQANLQWRVGCSADSYMISSHTERCVKMLNRLTPLEISRACDLLRITFKKFPDQGLLVMHRILLALEHEQSKAFPANAQKWFDLPFDKDLGSDEHLLNLKTSKPAEKETNEQDSQTICPAQCTSSTAPDRPTPAPESIEKWTDPDWESLFERLEGELSSSDRSSEDDDFILPPSAKRQCLVPPEFATIEPLSEDIERYFS